MRNILTNLTFEKVMLFFVSGIIILPSIFLSVSYGMIIFSWHTEIAIKIYQPIIKMIKLISQNWIILILPFILLFHKQICILVERVRELPGGIKLDTDITSIQTPEKALENVEEKKD